MIDAGPALWVEQRDGMPIIDASSGVCQALFGEAECGPPDTVTAVLAESWCTDDDCKVGPVTVPPDVLKSFRAGKV